MIDEKACVMGGANNDTAQDYLYNHLDTRELPDGRALWLIDLKGMLPTAS